MVNSLFSIRKQIVYGVSAKGGRIHDHVFIPPLHLLLHLFCKIISNNLKDYLLASIFFHTFVTCFDKHVHFYLLNRYSNWTLEM